MKVLIDIAIGFLLYILQLILQIPIAFIFRDPFTNTGGLPPSLTCEYLIGAVIMFLLSLAAALIFGTKTKAQAWRRAVIWTLMPLVLGHVLGVINAIDANAFNLKDLGWMLSFTLGNVGYYALLLGIFLGPVVYARIKKLE